MNIKDKINSEKINSEKISFEKKLNTNDFDYDSIFEGIQVNTAKGDSPQSRAKNHFLNEQKNRTPVFRSVACVIPFSPEIGQDLTISDLGSIEKINRDAEIGKYSLRCQSSSKEDLKKWIEFFDNDDHYEYFGHIKEINVRNLDVNNMEDCRLALQLIEIKNRKPVILIGNILHEMMHRFVIFPDVLLTKICEIGYFILK